MQLNQARIVLTGASGGLGGALTRKLAKTGAALLLTGRDPNALARITLPADCDYQLLQADLSHGGGIDSVVQAARAFGANILINNAGTNNFGLLAEQSWADVDRIMATNLAAPVRLTQAMLPWLGQQREAAIVNIGSTFGSVPFAGFAAYSAAKAGLRGFSQALRRELADGPVRVFHIAPRAIVTKFNSPAVQALNQDLGSQADTPEQVANQVIRMLQQNVYEGHIGFPERFFAWLNGLAPSLVDQGLRSKLSKIKHHASKA